MAKTSLNVKILECDLLHFCALNEETYYSDLAHFFVDWSKSQKLSKIKSPSVQMQEERKPVSLIYVREL